MTVTEETHANPDGTHSIGTVHGAYSEPLGRPPSALRSILDGTHSISSLRSQSPGPNPQSLRGHRASVDGTHSISSVRSPPRPRRSLSSSSSVEGGSERRASFGSFASLKRRFSISSLRSRGSRRSLDPESTLRRWSVFERSLKESQALAGLEDGGNDPVPLCKLLSVASTFEKAVLCFGIVCSIAHGAGMPLLCVFFGDFIDLMVAEIFSPGFSSLERVVQLSTMFLYIGCGIVAVGSVQGFVFPWFSHRLGQGMRPKYFDAALHKDVAWYDTHDVSALVHGINQDMETFQDGFGTKLGQSFMALGTTVIGFVLGIYYVWQVGLLLLVAVLLMGCAGAVVGKAAVRQMTEQQGPYAAAARLVSETLYAMRTVVAFGGEHMEMAGYAQQVQVAYRGGMRFNFVLGIAGGAVFGLYFLSQAMAFYYAMTLIYNSHNVAIADVMSSLFCVLTSGFTLGQIAPGFAGVSKAKLAMARYFNMKKSDSFIQKAEDVGEQLGTIDSITLDHISFAYPAKPMVNVLSDLCLEVKKGQRIGIVGESGSGKSTVMALLERFYDPSAGQVLINGKDLKEFSVKSLRKQIGYVGQEPVLFSTTIRANILHGKYDASEEELMWSAKRAKLDFIKKLPDGFDTLCGTGGSQLSGGQKQRIAIARALIKKPSLLFLDEATSALDPTSEQQIQRTINTLSSENDERGMTLVAIAHRLTTVQTSDVIYVLREGAVAEKGTHSELVRRHDSLYNVLATKQRVSTTTSEEDLMNERSRRGSMTSLGSWRDVQEGMHSMMTEDDRLRSITKTYKVPMRRLLRFCQPEWLWYIPGLIGTAASGAAFPCVAAYGMVDAGAKLGQPDREMMRKDVESTCVLIVIFAGMRWLGDFLAIFSFGVLTEAMSKRIRTAMLESVLKQDIGFHDDPENSPSRIALALEAWPFRVQNLCSIVSSNIGAMSSLVTGFVIAFYECWEMALMMMVLLPLLIAAMGLQVSASLGSQKADNASVTGATEVLSDALTNVRTVQAAGCERELLVLYSDIIASKSPWKQLFRHVYCGFTFGIASATLLWIFAAGFFFMGWLLSIERSEYLPAMRSFIGFLYAAMGFSLAFGLAGDMGKAKVAAHDIFELLDRRTRINGLEPVGRTPTKEEGLEVGHLEFRNIEFYYPFRQESMVLMHLSCTIEAGQAVGVVGPSGGGKSTLMAMIQRFYDPQGGGIFVGKERVPLPGLNIRWWRRQLGFVGQEPVLFDADVLQNVTYGLEGEEVSEEWLNECKRMANLHFLDSQNAEGWDTRVGMRGGRLSGGQKQRVAICRALLRDPPILLLDEATSALDSHSEGIVQAALEQAMKGRTSITIAHRLSTIRDCDVILVVAEGCIAEQGTHQELMAREGAYWKLVEQVQKTVVDTETKKSSGFGATTYPLGKALEAVELDDAFVAAKILQDAVPPATKGDVIVDAPAPKADEGTSCWTCN